jgi:hypothetical protein
VGAFPDNGQALLAADGTTVFAGVIGSQILSAPVTGGAFKSLYITALAALAVDAEDLFSSAGNQITLCPAKDCRQPVKIATAADAPVDLAVSGDVYFLAGSRIQRVARTGGTPIDVLLEQPVDWTVDASGLTFSRASGIFQCPLDACTTQAKIADATAAGAVATSGSDVVWIDGTTLRKGALGAAPRDLATIGLNATSIAIGPGRVYWREANRIASCPRSGGVPSILASGRDAPATDLASDATSIYWMTSDNRILRFTK